jgi:hypothetical protein
MYVLRIVRLFFLNAIWRITNLRPAGRALVRALGSANADACTVAGIFLVQAKHRSIPLLLEALDRRENVPMVLRVLADVGDTSVEHALQRWVRDSDPAVAAAAIDALKIVQHQPFKTA